MAIPLSDNILTDAPKPSDARYGPWATVADACASVPVSRRYLGLTVGILVNGVAQDYAWAIDLTNGKLLPKAGGSSTPSTSIGAAVTRSLTTQAHVLQLPAALVAAGIGSLKYELLPRVGPPPASYDTLLSAGNTQADGINALFASTQTAQTNAIAGVTGSLLTLQVLDSSDGGSTSSFDYLSGYAGTYLKFNKKDGSFREVLWPSTDSIISV